MSDILLSVRELRADDIPRITDYWLNSTPDHLIGMGVDVNKMPTRAEWEAMLSDQLNLSYEEKKSYCLIWEVKGKAAGHSNINDIVYGEEAFMHLHLWSPDFRQRGLGARLVRLSLPCFFDNCQLQRLYCEPYALNPAPNRTLEKAGFEFVKSYRTVPGFLSCEQKVNRWVLTRERFERLRHDQ